ncbi:hypothetical protein C1I98_15385 [Spongiactinospora gelatinilytica]|uniref:Uncharacterized protein n=1 Tax=Spongiactinospora gelatinilytica TaxID=2666298 RepID=A0A2W2I4P6_9ACTN|nr:hypothetical protein [Spongiactinospora gelatinilytica]PZG45504.1 hypothetical protein C1I98_15385 [Spongiactinospora gelatinilytica]
MSVAAAVAVIVVGAVLTFALADGPVGGSMGGAGQRIVGVILMLGGILGLLVPLFRTRSRWSGSTVRSRQDAIDDRSPPGPVAPAGRNTKRRGSRGPTADSDRPSAPGGSAGQDG